MRLDDLDFGGNVGFVKIDVEGMEMQVLAGATGLFTNRGRILLLKLTFATSVCFGNGRIACVITWSEYFTLTITTGIMWLFRSLEGSWVRNSNQDLCVCMAGNSGL